MLWNDFQKLISEPMTVFLLPFCDDYYEVPSFKSKGMEDFAAILRCAAVFNQNSFEFANALEPCLDEAARTRLLSLAICLPPPKKHTKYLNRLIKSWFEFTQVFLQCADPTSTPASVPEANLLATGAAKDGRPLGADVTTEKIKIIKSRDEARKIDAVVTDEYINKLLAASAEFFAACVGILTDIALENCPAQTKKAAVAGEAEAANCIRAEKTNGMTEISEEDRKITDADIVRLHAMAPGLNLPKLAVLATTWSRQKFLAAVDVNLTKFYMQIALTEMACFTSIINPIGKAFIDKGYEILYESEILTDLQKKVVCLHQIQYELSFFSHYTIADLHLLLRHLQTVCPWIWQEATGENILFAVAETLNNNAAWQDLLDLVTSVPEKYWSSRIYGLVRQATIELNQWELCLKYCENELQTGKAEVKTYYDAGYAWYNLGEFADSLAVLRQGMAIYGHLVKLSIGSAYALIAMEKYDEALNCLYEVADEVHESGYCEIDYNLALAQTYIALKRPSKALPIYRYLTDVYGPQAVFCRDRARALSEMGYKEEALRVVREGLKFEPDDTNLLLTRCFLHASMPYLSHKQTLLSFKQALAGNKLTAEELDQLAVAALHLDLYDIAGEAIINAWRQDKYFAPLYYTIALYWQAKGQGELAQRVLDYVLQFADDRYDYLMFKATLYMESGEFTTALEYLDYCQHINGINLEIALGKMQIYRFWGLEDERLVWSTIAKSLGE